MWIWYYDFSSGYTFAFQFLCRLIKIISCKPDRYTAAFIRMLFIRDQLYADIGAAIVQENYINRAFPSHITSDLSLTKNGAVPSGTAPIGENYKPIMEN